MKPTKYTTIAALIAITPLFLVGCASQGGLASTGMGSDTAMINQARGSATSVISKAQEDQYERQVRVVKNDLELQQAKERAQRDSINGTLGTVRNIANTANGLISVFTGR